MRKSKVGVESQDSARLIYMQRLYTLFQPETYSLSLAFERAQRTFSGTVTITGHSAQQNELRLHAKDLEISSAQIDGTDTTHSQDGDELILTPKESIKAGEHTATISFSGIITDPMHGLYPCYYEHNSVKKEWLATQFESHHAREVFPCIDEPEAKATFDVTLATEANITVLGNMPVKEQHTKDQKLVTSFETSPKMSTYLLAFVAGEMQSLETKTKSGVLVRSWATPAQPKENLAFSLQHTADTIDFFNNYFGVPYPLPKCDNVALPDFSSGAMENWGLITYRETALLVDPKNTPIAHKQQIASVITHELSHQWFGNLVTMKWWDELWLNESFASLMEYVGVDALYPEWSVWLDFGPNDRAPALHRDMLPGVQAIKTDVNHPDEISTLFDPAIVYAKGATVLNMLKNYIGDEAFRDGLRLYFSRHQYANTAGSDLWVAFSETSDRDINSFMNAWLEKPGYPVVRIDQKGKKLRLEQQRLLSSREKDTTSLWPIPLYAEPRLEVEVLKDRQLSLEAPDQTYRLLNKGSSGVFVTNYVSAIHRDYLAELLASGSLEPADRLRLLHESLLLARTGEQSLVSSIALALKADREDRDAVWDIISLIIADTRRFIEHDKSMERSLKQRVQTLIAPQLEILGLVPLKDDTGEIKKRRATLFALGVWSEHEDALGYALEQFDSFLQPENLDAEARGIIYAAGARWKGKDAYQKLFQVYKDTSSAEEKQALAGGMVATRDLSVIKTLLGHIKNQNVVRLQDVPFWFVYLVRKQEARDVTWQWLLNEWGWIEDKFGSDKSYDYFPRYASGALFGAEWLEAYRAFFEPKIDQPSLKRVVGVGIEEITSRTAWFERDEPGLRKFLS